MPSRLSAFVIWAALAGSLVFWVLRLGVTAPAAPAYTLPVAESMALRGDLTRLFGAAPAAAATPVAAPPDIATRFRLLGVAAPLPKSPQGPGLALLSVDGKPARAVHVGARVDGDLILRGVSRRAAEIGTAAGQTLFTLEVPLRQAAATGRLPPPAPMESAEGDETPPPQLAPPAPVLPPAPVVPGMPRGSIAPAAR